MGFELTGDLVGCYPADTDMSVVGNNQFTGVCIGKAKNTDGYGVGGTAILTMAQGGVFFGVLQNNPVQGEAGTVMIAGISKIIAGGAFNGGDSLMVLPSGTFKRFDGTKPPVGIACEDAQAGDITSMSIRSTAFATAQAASGGGTSDGGGTLQSGAQNPTSATPGSPGQFYFNSSTGTLFGPYTP